MPSELSKRARLARVDAELAAAKLRRDDLAYAWAVAAHTSSGRARPADLDVELARAEADVVALEERLAEIDGSPVNDVAPAPASAPASPPERAPAPEALPEFVDTKQAAALLGVSPKTLEGLRRRGGGPPFVRVGKTVRYRRADLTATVQGTVQRNRPTRR